MASEVVDWQTMHSSVSSRLGKLLEIGIYTDCTFTVGSEDNCENIRAHRLILSAASAVFETMFFGSMADQNAEPIKILDVEPNAFKLMLRYIYTDHAQLSSFTEVCEICYAAKKYMIPSLVEQCVHFIWKDLHPGNVCRALEFAQLFEEPQIVDKCINMIRESTEEIVKLPIFCEIGISILEIILSQEELQISEIDLWSACISWAKALCLGKNVEINAANQRNALQPVIHLIRFLAMTPNQFANGPATTNILTIDESYKILINLSSGATNMPNNLCNKTDSRNGQSGDGNSSGLSCCTPLKYLTCTCGSVRIDSFVNEQLIDCTLAFECNTHITIEGLRLPTQLNENRPLNETCAAVNNEYSELIYAFLQDSDGCRLTYTHCSARVSYQDSLDIFFNRLTLIQPNKKYKIVAALNKVGRYPIYSVDRLVSTNNIVFNFSDNFGKTSVKAVLFSIP